MRTDQTLEFFGGSARELALAIGITPSAVAQWGRDVPMSRRQSVRMAMKERAERLELEARTLRRAAKECEQ